MLARLIGIGFFPFLLLFCLTDVGYLLGMIVIPLLTCLFLLVRHLIKLAGK
jgi:hypothetical protein